MYIEQAYKGKHEPWRYIVTFFIVIGAQVIGSIPFSILYGIKIATGEVSGDFRESFNPEVLGLSQNVGLILMMIPWILTFFALILAMRYIHGYSLTQIFTSTKRFRWNNFLMGLIAWFALMLIADVIYYQFNSENYIFNFNPKKFYPLLLIVFLTIPLQASAEELYFRGNLMQGFGLWTKSRIASVFITSFFFGILHISNPEVKQFGILISMGYYISFGLFMGIILIMDGGLEIPFAIHTANNIYGAAFVGYSGSVLQTPSLYKVVKYDSTTMLLVFLAAAIIFLLVFRNILKWKSFIHLTTRLK